jgi:hypothetical protein
MWKVLPTWMEGEVMKRRPRETKESIERKRSEIVRKTICHRRSGFVSVRKGGKVPGMASPRAYIVDRLANVITQLKVAHSAASQAAGA